jgi:hypothetical protein
MKILPNEKLTLLTELSKSNVIEILNLSIRPKQNFGFGNGKIEEGKKFEGNIFRDSFNISRIINYRNSFLPEISGKINEKINGTEIEIELKQASFVKGFMILWLGGVSFAFITTFIGAIIGEGPLYACIFPLFMFLAGFGMLKFGFSTESEKSKKDLIEILKARIKK